MRVEVVDTFPPELDAVADASPRATFYHTNAWLYFARARVSALAPAVSGGRGRRARVLAVLRGAARALRSAVVAPVRDLRRPGGRRSRVARADRGVSSRRRTPSRARGGLGRLSQRVRSRGRGGDGSHPRGRHLRPASTQCGAIASTSRAGVACVARKRWVWSCGAPPPRTTSLVSSTCIARAWRVGTSAADTPKRCFASWSRAAASVCASMWPSTKATWWAGTSTSTIRTT